MIGRVFLQTQSLDSQQNQDPAVSVVVLADACPNLKGFGSQCCSCPPDLSIPGRLGKATAPVFLTATRLASGESGTWQPLAYARDLLSCKLLVLFQP